MEKPLISVIIPTYNRAGYIKRAIQSALEQTYKNIEIVIVDDGSTDGTRDIIKPYLSDARVHYIYQENQKATVARNNGIKTARGKYIAILDSDDFWCDNDKLEKQADFLEKNTDYVLVGGGGIKVDEEGKEAMRYLMTEKDEDIKKILLIENQIVHVSFLFRKDVFDKVGGYDKDFDGLEDQDLLLKMGKLGKFYNFQEFFVCYRGHSDARPGYFAELYGKKRRLHISIKLIEKYRNDYQGFYKALLLRWAVFLYSFLPFKDYIWPVAIKVKNLIFGRYINIQEDNGNGKIEEHKLRVCYVASTDMAVKFLLLNQLKFLKSCGYDVSAVCPGGKFIKDIEAEGVKVKTINFKRGMNPFAHLATLFNLFFYFRAEKFTIVHTHNPVPGLLGQLAAKFAGVPIIVNTLHGLYFTDDSSFLKRKFFIFLEKVASNCSTLIFSQNKEDIETMIKEKICKPKKVKYLGNGIDLQKFNPARFTADFISQKKKELNVPADCKIIGMVGRLVKEKGYLDLFEAFKIVLEKFPGSILMCIGPEEPGKKDSVSPGIAKEYGIAENILFLGQRTDVDQLYPLMDIFVLPSWREGFPRSVLEASAMKRPIVATDIRGCREAVENNKTGILVPVKSPEKLAEAIIFLLSSPEEDDKLAENAHKKAINEFDERRICDIINTNYKALLEVKGYETPGNYQKAI